MSTPFCCSSGLATNFLLNVSYGYFFSGSTTYGFLSSFFLASFLTYSAGGGTFFFSPINLTLMSLYLGAIFYPLNWIYNIFSEFLRTYPSNVAISKGYFNIFLICYSSNGMFPAFVFFSIYKVSYGILKNKICPEYVFTLNNRQKSWI